MIPVVAVIKAKMGREKQLEDLLRKLVSPTRQEPGCGAYELHKDLADARCFIFIESWRSDNDLQSHLTSPHIQAAMARRDELIESIEIRSLQSLDPARPF